MIKVEFEYKDKYTNGNWSKQECTADNLQQVIEWYGLGVDCDYRILSVMEVEN